MQNIKSIGKGLNSVEKKGRLEMMFQTAFIVLSLIPDRGMCRGRICSLHRFHRKRL